MLVDSHCHLDAPEFDADRGAVVARAQGAGVVNQIIPAVTAASWPKLRDVCANGRGLFPAYGLHPMYLHEHRPEHLAQLREWIEKEKPVAVGECGLDFFVDGLDAQQQQLYFDGQLKLAREFDLPLIIHARRAVDQVIASIRKINGTSNGGTLRLRGVVHSFSGSEEQAQQLWKLGFLLGIGGPATYERANRLRKLVATMPLEFLLLETDAPDQPDSGIRGQRNEPARLAFICEAFAEIRGIDASELARVTSENARRLFKLPLLQADATA